ncbi:MAG: IS3 family transposase [Cyclobacteriaceae bacterium]
MNELYQCVGISKQAVHQHAKRQAVLDDKVEQLLIEAQGLRRDHPGCGVEKMYYALKPDFMGRDRFIALFMELGFGLKKVKNHRRTTFAGKLYYPNLIKGLKVSESGVVWQTDITYILMQGEFYYAIFIIDVYTKQIVGYQVSNHMRASANIKALKMAFKEYQPPLIHHSDRGSQYSSIEYTTMLKTSGCKISMGLIAQDNAYAERINRTIKEEYIDHWKPTSLGQLKGCLRKAVNNYNSRRPHRHLKYQTPDQFKESPKSKKTITIFE